MSSTRRRRWMDVLRRTAGVGGTATSARSGLDDADLWTSREEAARAAEGALRAAERLEATSARGRGRADAASERATLLAARAEGLGVVARRVLDTFDRLRMVALNAGLEGARLSEAQGHALLLVGEEIRATVERGVESARELGRIVDEIGGEASALRERSLEVRADAAELAADAATAKEHAQEGARALDRLERQLQRATGFDPEVARAVSHAAEHAKGLLAAISTIQTSQLGSAALGALRPVLRPVARALVELAVEPDGDGADEAGA